MIDPHLHDKIEAYLLGQLPASEAKEVEARAAADAAFGQQVETQRAALVGMGRLAELDLLEKFAAWDEEMAAAKTVELYPEKGFSEKKEGARVVPIRWLLAAAACGLLALCTFWLFEKTGPDRPETAELKRAQQKLDELAAENGRLGSDDSLAQIQIRTLREEVAQKEAALQNLQNRPAQNPAPRPTQTRELAFNAALPASKFVEASATRGTFESRDPVLKSAIEAFEKQDFGAAERILKGIPAGDARQLQVGQMLPYALFYGKKFEAAIPAFLKLKNEDRIEAPNAEWYLLLCYAADMGRHGAKAGFLLNGILGNAKHPHLEEARALEGRLREKGWL